MAMWNFIKKWEHALWFKFQTRNLAQIFIKYCLKSNILEPEFIHPYFIYKVFEQNNIAIS